MSDPVSDDDLVVRARGGHLDAFDELVRRHYRSTYRIAYRVLGDASDAEDATQSAFERAWRSLGSFRGDATFRTWLYRIVTNQALKSRQRGSRELVSDQVLDLADRPDRRPDAIVEQDLRGAAVREAIAALPTEQRVPLVLREFGDCSYEEIAAIMAITPAAVRGRLHRARLELMGAMRPWT